LQPDKEFVPRLSVWLEKSKEVFFAHFYVRSGIILKTCIWNSANQKKIKLFPIFDVPINAHKYVQPDLNGVLFY